MLVDKETKDFIVNMHGTFNTNFGKEILGWMKEQFMHDSEYESDPSKLYYNQGQRSVVEEIIRYLDPNYIDELKKLNVRNEYD